MKKPSRHIEFYWLCNDCAAAMTLTYKKGIGVTTKPLARAQGAASLEGLQRGAAAYFPLRAFQRIFSTSPNMRIPSRNGLMRVPSLCAHVTGTSATVKLNFFAR